MISASVVLMVLGIVCLLLAALHVQAPRLDLQPLGIALVVLAFAVR